VAEVKLRPTSLSECYQKAMGFIYLACTIDEVVLIKNIHGLRLVEAARSQYSHVLASIDLFAGLFDYGYSVAHVASQRNECSVR
jgi:hypothetical protein